MKRLFVISVSLLAATFALEAQEMQYTREQFDSIIAEAAADYEAPVLGGVRLEGNVEDIALEFIENGWTDPFLKFSKEALENAGLHRHNVQRKGILLEKDFPSGKRFLVLHPISGHDRRIAFAALTYPIKGKYVTRFVRNDVMPMVRRYAEKYGEYRVTDINNAYRQSNRRTSAGDYGCERPIITFRFDDPEVILRAETARDGSFHVVVQYINRPNLAIKLLEDAD